MKKFCVIFYNGLETDVQYFETEEKAYEYAELNSMIHYEVGIYERIN